MGQLKKSRRGVPQNLSELWARTEGSKSQTGGGCLGDESAGRTVNASPSSSCKRAGRRAGQEPTAAASSTVGTKDFFGRQKQPREQGRPPY